MVIYNQHNARRRRRFQLINGHTPGSRCLWRAVGKSDRDWGEMGGQGGSTSTGGRGWGTKGTGRGTASFFFTPHLYQAEVLKNHQHQHPHEDFYSITTRYCLLKIFFTKFFNFFEIFFVKICSGFVKSTNTKLLSVVLCRFDFSVKKCYNKSSSRLVDLTELIYPYSGG